MSFCKVLKKGTESVIGFFGREYSWKKEQQAQRHFIARVESGGKSSRRKDQSGNEAGGR